MTGDEFLAIRTARRWTQEQVADRVGISLRNVRYYERGYKEIPRVVALAMAHIADQGGISKRRWQNDGLRQ